MKFFVRIGTLRLARLASVLAVGVLSFIFTVTFVRAQSPTAVSDLAARINRERISRGLIPYALNTQLSIAAQTHADDIVHTGHYSHTGSDGSTVFDRVARTGYGAYSWGRRLGENWAWYHDAPTAMQMWMGSLPHRDNILHQVYREFGIGIAPVEAGGFIYVVDFGAQPNVLPVFIQNGASDTASSNVVIALSNEDFATNGDGANTIGKAKEVQVSSSPNFTGAQWQLFASRFEWALPSGIGTKTVYVKYRDVRGRTVTSNDSIGSSASLAATPTRAASPTLKPTPKPSPSITRPRPTTTAVTSASPSNALTPEGPAIPSLIPSLESTMIGTLQPTTTPTPEATETLLVSVAMIAGETPVGAIDSQAEIQLTEPLPTVAPTSNDILTQDQVTPITLGIFGMSVMLGVLAVVRWLAHRTDYD